MAELKPGYKVTELGVIPDEWEIVSLGEILKIRHGKSQKDVVTPSGTFPILATGGEIGRTNTPIYSKPSVLIGRKGTIDIPRYMETPFWTVDTLFYSEISEASHPKFIYYKFQMIDWYLYNEASGVPSLNARTIENIRISIPKTKREQCAIAAALSDVDAQIAALDALIVKKRDIKQGAMQRLLTGEQRLPGFSGEWETKHLGKMLAIRHGKSQREVIDPAGVYPILATGGEIGRTNTPLYCKPSVLIGRKGTIDTPQYMESPFWTVDTLFYSEIFPGNDEKFLFYKFWMIDWYSYNEASGVPSLNAKTIENIEVTVPPTKDEQTGIATVLSDMDREIAALEWQREKTVALKQGMMQELLTGKTRLI